ncbi:isocitrate lyase/PEP mutase family protein [Propylenella binzhouense]|uniref:Isocitrate lyase/phosphoenolpyruvate mutase family protein n=1 Tax=Propylenella binzhouense TaxID=2555902 RepID=A0A964T709_9HYPH|nr:isocitrate lyase/phosphoenolpyruvate mutase family protein [Propylenella binzhouense]MYZ49004.1 isocitrate lyase/phosphoenolpyruvate mutase family protein [Propylenella binzhouense]
MVLEVESRSTIDFRALHARERLFVMPNPWDAGTARLLADLGFEALATSSAALAWTLGRPDATGGVTRDEAIAHAVLIHRATGLPVNGDFESGYGDTPQAVAETVRRAIDAGVAGCSIEDQDQAAGGGALYPPAEAARRFEAAREAVERSGSGFVLTGRSEAFFAPGPDPLKEAVRRLKVYEAAGADAVYAPGVTAEHEVAEIVGAVSVPVNVLGGLGGVSNDLAALARLGVRRVSIGSGLAKVALGGFLRAASALADGRFDYGGAAASSILNGAFARPDRDDGDDED